MVEIIEAIIEIVGTIIGLFGAMVAILIEFPILLIPIVVGIIAVWLGGSAGWVCFIAVQLATTAALKRRAPRDRRKVLVGWGVIHLIPLGACVVFFAGRQQMNIGIGIGSIWAFAFLLIVWKVPGRSLAEAPAED
ncbi:MAG: hypothetical protein ACI9U2_004297 [Bradymonadia bacterium]|jgi:hypothetical protein